MQKLDASSLTADELASKTVSKCRYLQFRDDLSTTSKFGFRIEGISFSKEVDSKFEKPEKIELQRMKKPEALKNFNNFVEANKLEKKIVVNQLEEFREAVTKSEYLKNHQVKIFFVKSGSDYRNSKSSHFLYYRKRDDYDFLLSLYIFKEIRII